MAELTVACCVGILQHTAGYADVILEVLRAGLTARRVNHGVLDRGAFGRCVRHGGGKETINCATTINTVETEGNRTHVPRYVKGETRYMKIQKWGKAVGPVGGANTPLNTKQSEKSKLAGRERQLECVNRAREADAPKLPPVTASGIPAMIMCVNVEVNNRNCQIYMRPGQ